MGIRPENGTPLPAPTSTAEERYGDLITELETDGSTAGEVLGSIHAEANSAQTGATELAADVTALEQRVNGLPAAATAATAGTVVLRAATTGQASIAAPTAASHIANKGYVDGVVADALVAAEVSGTGWVARKRCGVVTVHFNKTSGTITLPDGFRPISMSYFVVTTMIDTVSTPAHVGITSLGAVTPVGTTEPYYGTAVFINE